MSAGLPSTGPYRCDAISAAASRAASIASGGGPHDTIPCPREIVPGFVLISSPTIGMIGAWTAFIRDMGTIKTQG